MWRAFSLSAAPERSGGAMPATFPYSRGSMPFDAQAARALSQRIHSVHDCLFVLSRNGRDAWAEAAKHAVRAGFATGLIASEDGATLIVSW